MTEPMDQPSRLRTSASTDVPAGDHPVEVAARAGIGPLSAMGQKVWHGEAIPCVSCGQLVRRNSAHCGSCGQDLGDEMIAKMRKHAGPWYVLEHLRPFPGVALDRILLQVRRGLITPTSIVRGPASDYQWRFAVETPGLCLYFGRCWNCFHGVKETESYCPACLSHLGFEKPATAPASVGSIPPPTQQAPSVNPPPSAGQAVTPPVRTHATRSSDLDELAMAAQQTHQSQPQHLDHPAHSGPVRAGWIAAAVVVFVFASLLWFTTVRGNKTPGTSPERSAITAPPTP